MTARGGGRALALAAALVLAGTPVAQAVEGFPGETWGRVSRELSADTGTGISFFVNQGVDWVRLPGDVMLNTFAEYRYARRTKDRTYFDAEGEALGIDLRRAPFHLGAEYFWERLPEQGTSSGIARAYFTWYADWYKYLRRRLAERQGFLRMTALSGHTWGRVRHELEDPGYTTVSFFINQGIDWFELPGNITVNTYVEPRFSYRSHDAEYYNTLGPAVGLELQRTPLRLGTDYFWEYFTERHEWVETWRLYFTWYYNWDLRNLARGGD